MSKKPYKPYAEKLKDPRWQRKRLEILQRDDWRCTHCDTTERTLHVHHGYYEAGLEPWEYPDEALTTLCEDCHKDATEFSKAAKDLIGQLSVNEMETVVAYMRALIARANGRPMTAKNYEEADGIAATYGLPPECVIRALDENGVVDQALVFTMSKDAFNYLGGKYAGGQAPRDPE